MKSDLTTGWFHCIISFQQTLKGVIPVKQPSHDINVHSLAALHSCLDTIPFLHVTEIIPQAGSGTVHVDFLLSMMFSQHKKFIAVAVRSSGQPRFTREAVNQLARFRDRQPDVYGVFMAPFISREAAKICSQENMGYVDLAGNCLISFDTIYLERDGKPNPFSERRTLHSLYSPKAERILRVLLMHPKREWKVQDLSKEAHVSLGQVSNVKRLLMDREWIDITEKGFRLIMSDALLTEWASRYTFKRNRMEQMYTVKSIPESEAAIASFCRKNDITYAFTAFSGAARMLSAIRYQKVMVYTESTDALASALGMTPASTGANSIFLSPYDDGVFYGSQLLDGVSVVSPIQLYLDLFSNRGRGEETAQALLEEVIRPRW